MSIPEQCTGRLHWDCLRAGTDIEDAAALEKQLSDIEVTISYENGVQQVFLNGENVTGLIRTEQVSDMTSRSSAKPQVRAKLTELPARRLQKKRMSSWTGATSGR